MDVTAPSTRSGTRLQPAARSSGTPGPATILVVDDLSANRAVLVTLLSKQGHRLLEAADGRQALDVVRNQRPDLVITDVLMPVMDGYEFVRQLRLDPATSRTPVLFYSAPYGEREARAIAQSSGVRYVLRKPVNAEDVLAIVGRVLAGEPEPVALEAALPSAKSDREHLRLLTHQLSENAGDLKVANARLRALINIGLDLSSLRDTERLLQTVCAAAHDLFCATYVTLGIVDPSDHVVRRVGSCGANAGNWLKVGDLVPEFLATVVTERRTLRGQNPGGHPAGLELELPAHHPEIQAFLAAPIASPTRVYGWICLVCNEDRVYTEEDENLVLALSGQVGRIYEIEHEILERELVESELRRERAERTEALAALRTAEERMRFALQNADVGIWDQDFTTGVLRWSEILEAQYGLAPGTFEGTFEAFVAAVHPEDREAVLETVGKAMRSGDDFSVENRSVHPDGTVRWLSGAGRFHLGEDGRPVRGVGISLDVTERHALEEQYHQAQKMEAIGRLAGGVAHDFNNLLTVILGYCELLLADPDPDDSRREDIAAIQKAGISAAGLTRQLLAFSRKEIIEPTLLDLNAVVDGVRGMIGRLIKEDVNLALALQDGLGLVKADRGHMEQILLNLVVNAGDAMPAGGTLTLGTANVELDESYPTTHLSGKPGSFVVLTVTDTGTGMSRAVQARLFEPFFTTKELGRGTGLGLATVHGIVKHAGGSINVYSEVGHGTSFKVYFPRAEGGEPMIEPPLQVPRHMVAVHAVLVVEDAEGLRELTRRVLERQGYTVVVAANAEEALALFEESPSIDVLLTDVVMPGGSGPELAGRLALRQPALKVVYMSGYTEDAIVQHGVLSPGIAFLHKPFTSETLGRKLREVLER